MHRTVEIIPKTLLLFSTFLILFILLFCINTFYWSDDYAFLLDLNKNGIIKHCYSWYFEWDGRTLTLGGFIQALGLSYWSVEFLTFFWSICFLGSGFLAFYIVKEELNISKKQIKNKFLLINLIMITFWMGSFLLLSEVIYWAVGGYYSLTLFIGAIWILYYLKYQKREITTIKKGYFIVFTFLAGASTQNLTIALITLVVLTMIIDLLENNKKVKLFNFMLFLSLTSGLIFVSIAPGNWLRIDTLKNEQTLSIGLLIENYLLILYYYLSRALVLVPLSFLCGLGIFFSGQSQNKINSIKQFTFLKNRITFSKVLKNAKWILVALSTILPFIFFPQLITFRTTVYFHYFVLIFIIFITIKISNRIFYYDKNKSLVLNNILSVLFFMPILLVTAYFAYTNFSKGLILKKAIVERETKLEDPTKKSVELEIINTSLIPKCYEFVDFVLDNSKGKFGTINYQEEYYNKTIIIVK
ncbi:DUF6056 family protein [Flavobacterium sp.]|uniref:DUF6056 family protein n=1 Tax=Flavobacterium sp. TaxID=239 RepID=UPI00374CFC67